MVWGGISHRPLQATQPYPDCHEILGLTVRTYNGAVSPGLLLVRDKAQPHVVRTGRMHGGRRHRYHWFVVTLNRIPLGHYVLVHLTPQGCTSDWDTIQSSRGCQSCIKTTENSFELLQWNSKKQDQPTASFLHSDFQGAFEFSRLIIFISVKWRGSPC